MAAPGWDPERGNVIGDVEALRIHQAAAARGGSKTKPKDRPALVIPEPEIRAHVVDWTDKAAWPQGARTIGNLAVKQGFTVIGSHSRGPYIGDIPLRVMDICDSLLLRMRHEDGRRCAATWMNRHDSDGDASWGLDGMLLLTPWLQLVKSEAFKEYLRTPREPSAVVSDPVTPEAVVDLDAFDVAPSASTAPTEGDPCPT